MSSPPPGLETEEGPTLVPTQAIAISTELSCLIILFSLLMALVPLIEMLYGVQERIPPIW